MEQLNFDKITENQIKAGEFLKSFEPVLMPFESMAKYGIALASAFFGISCTLLEIPVFSSSKENTFNWILFCSWSLFLGSFIFGSIELYRTLKFRDQMRKFSYVLLGDKPNEENKKYAMYNIKESYISAVILQSIFLTVGIIVFILWVLLRIK